MKRFLKYFSAMLLAPAAVSAAPTTSTPSSDSAAEAGIGLQLSIWKPGDAIPGSEAEPAPSRWLRPPRSALLWLPDDPSWSRQGAPESFEPRRQLEW
jgi:hypothetical protein